MRIDSYSFGQVVIDGKKFTKDVIIFADRVSCPWWRRQGHVLAPEDLEAALSAAPEILIIGSGYSAAMRVPDSTLAFLKTKGIEARVEKTEKAVEIFNRSAGSNVAAALHLTC